MSRGLVALVVVGTLLMLLASALEGTASTSQQERAVLRVVRSGEAAILRDRPDQVCRLMTRRARRNALVLADLDIAPTGRRRPRPMTCVQAVGYQIDDARARGELKALRTTSGREARVIRILGNRAHVRKAGPTEIYLLKRKDGWRLDFANFAPFDGSSGR